MLEQVFSTIGSAVGMRLGGGIFSTVGRFAGQLAGNYLEQLNQELEEYDNFKNVRDSFNLSKAVYGEAIPLVFGSVRVNGKIIWANQVKEIENTITEERDKAVYHTIKYEYYLSVAVAICEGEIAELARVWANNRLINLGDYRFRLYQGSEEQPPDPAIIAASLEGKVPAFRDLAYIVFEDLPLADFGNSVPNFSFEVTRKANIIIQPRVEELVKSIVMIPGSGEFVYDPIIQHQTIKNSIGEIITQQAINGHNYHNIANSLNSLNQLQITCPNIEWIAPVVCWFGDDLDAANCRIEPKIEFNEENSFYSEEWQVGRYRRSSARLVSRDMEGNPSYGGSVNDASVIRYLAELKRRNLKIMFYPMLFLDIDHKPWRGHLTGEIGAIAEFFNKEAGYNNFILHYADLVKDYVDVFVIGSELIGLTKIREGNSFPAVIELIKLARLVKRIVGQNVLVTYAADWSEYHHTEEGWYNLDPLWASPDIDFVGIDAYFPVTRTTSSAILAADIVNGWQSGEGYEYYLDQAGIKHELAAAYAWKNLDIGGKTIIIIRMVKLLIGNPE